MLPPSFIAAAAITFAIFEMHALSLMLKRAAELCFPRRVSLSIIIDISPRPRDAFRY